MIAWFRRRLYVGRHRPNSPGPVPFVAPLAGWYHVDWPALRRGGVR